MAVKADSAHYSGDVLLNLSVIAALWLVNNSVLWADAVMTALIALYLLWTAWQLALESLRHLLDEELTDSERTQIVDVLHQLPEVYGVDQLKTRQAGIKVFVQLRLLLSDQLSLLHAHDIVDQAEHKVAALFRDADVIIHADPVSVVPVPEYPKTQTKTGSQP